MEIFLIDYIHMYDYLKKINGKLKAFTGIIISFVVEKIKLSTIVLALYWKNPLLKKYEINYAKSYL